MKLFVHVTIINFSKHFHITREKTAWLHASMVTGHVQ